LRTAQPSTPHISEQMTDDARAVLDASGANAEIERLRAVLHAAHGVMATLREENQHLLSLALALTLEPVIADMPSDEELRDAAPPRRVPHGKRNRMTKFQVVQGDLVAALNDCLLAAGKDPTRPMLTAVFLEGAAGDQFVTLTSTDRFMLVHCRVNTVDPLDGDVRALIPSEQAKTLVGVHKLPRTRRGPLEPLDIDVNEFTLTAGQINVPLDVDREFVEYKALFPKADAVIDVLPVDLALLLRVQKMSCYHKGRGVRLRFTEGKHDDAKPPRIIVVDFCDDSANEATKVILMPMRMPG
jgi:hypothetical protein